MVRKDALSASAGSAIRTERSIPKTRPKTKILVDGGDPQETRRVKDWLGFVDGGINVSNHGLFIVFATGIALKRDRNIVVAVGVSGGSGEQDHTVAEAGAMAF